MELVGRHDVIGAINTVLAAGHGTFALVGPPGAGVTTVLDHGSTLITENSQRLLHASGRRSERDVAVAMLRELAAADATGDLARRLTAAAEGSYEALLLEWASSATPTVLVIDDLHLADEVSSRALSYLARRTGHTSVAVVAGAHDTLEFDAHDLEPLSVDELMTIVRNRFDATDDAVARRVAELASGSPLIAVELARALDDDQRAGRSPLPAFPVTTTPIRHAYAAALDDLPTPTRHALCAAAAEPTGELRVIAAALGALGAEIESLDAAEAAGIVEIDAGRVRFDHPIRRSVCYHQLPPASRRAAHRALAGALDAPHDAERRAAHLSIGVTTPDETIANDFELVAQAAERRRDFLEAVRWWTAAARLSPRSVDAHRREANARSAGDPQPDPIAGLTKAERRVAAVVGTGLTNKAAAATLFVSVKTVDSHLQSIYRKLGISSRSELAVLVTHTELAGAADAS